MTPKLIVTVTSLGATETILRLNKLLGVKRVTPITTQVLMNCVSEDGLDSI